MTDIVVPMPLSGRVPVAGAIGPARIARLRTTDSWSGAACDAALLTPTASSPAEADLLFCMAGVPLPTLRPGQTGIILSPHHDYLGDGDVVRLDPARQHLYVIYRRRSQHNSLLVTEQCNSYCVMCSQPPRDRDDSILIDDLLQAIPLMSPETEVLGLTGGEPTLNFGGFMSLLSSLRQHLPDTAVHVLSNGRLFAYTSRAEAVAAVGISALNFGIPLYSDLPWEHDRVVQARGAFDQTIAGLLNLARFGVGVEIRVVIHRFTCERLPELARFIARNLPFASHVALMGLEQMGFGKSNMDSLWIDPAEYGSHLADAVCTLHAARVPVSIYNHQLCTLDRTLWPFSAQSISDWKNVYPVECGSCAVRGKCGGFFASSTGKRSARFGPVPESLL